MLTTRARRMAIVLMSLLAALGSFVVLSASPPPSDPFQAPYVDNQPHALAANVDAWFKFDYGANNTLRTMVLVTLVNAADSGLRFEVWSPDLIRRWAEIEPLNIGAVAELDCETGQMLIGGPCLSKDVAWTGAFQSAGTYFVRVINDASSSRAFRLMVLGPGVVTGAPAAARASGVGSTPLATATPSVVDDPNRGTDIDGQPKLLQAKSTAWHKFSYGITNSNARPLARLRLVNGVSTGVGFEVWSPQNIGEWWQSKPIGRGTPEVVVNCGGPSSAAAAGEGTPTPTPEPMSPEHCASNDLTWSGAFGGPGLFYVRVVNENSWPVEYVLLLQ